ncbi:hypothetical protein BJV77DRAFT_207042 [Russula vinacea]|nr:hypothetical protein BJV77DRAFT_207042 [Russula vinacea]
MDPPGAAREWTGTLYMNGTSVLARAREIEAFGNLNPFPWPAHLQLEPVSDPNFNIQAWINITGAPWVPLRCYDETFSRQFDNMVATLKSGHCYAIARCMDCQGRTLVRLLLAPVGEILLCAVIPDNGIPMQPTH